jgi:NAD(P)H-dependent flavin oxidoreductase YrpB (nitropropane dioxygenase family)
VSAAGGLGTIGMLSPHGLRSEIEAARALTTKPIAVNLLLPFARAAHFRAADEADTVFTFWGAPRRMTERTWIHQCGSVEEAVAARDAGADAVIVQGIEAGGHVRGDLPALELLSRARRALPAGYPILVAGGIATAADVRAALDAGADAAVLGTRFLLSDESRAHAEYKHRLLRAERTLLTDLFGLGWPARHRVVPNAATERWREHPPAWMSALHRASGSLSRALPVGGASPLGSLQRPWLPLLMPKSATVDDAPTLVDAGPLYAGETVLRIRELLPAAQIVSAVTP